MNGIGSEGSSTKISQEIIFKSCIDDRLKCLV